MIFLKFLAVWEGPQFYSIDIENEILSFEDQSIDMSNFPAGGVFEGIDTGNEIKNTYIDSIKREANGDLYLILVQEHPKNGPKFWAESDWINAADYDPEVLYIKENSTWQL